jgi:streptogramin lyase
MGEDANFWFTLSNSSKVARITPRGRISYVRTPSLSNPAFITPGPDGNIWFGEGSTGRIASVTPDGVITEHQFSFFGVSVGITTGSDGNIWFTDQTDHAVWRYAIARAARSRNSRRPRPIPSPAKLPLVRMATCGSPSRRWTNSAASPPMA